MLRRSLSEGASAEMIEKLLRFQTLPGPYLGPSPAVMPPSHQGIPVRFQQWLQPPVPLLQTPPLALSSVSQHLQLQMRPAAQAGQYQLQYHPLQPVSQLSQTVQQQLSQHPVRSQAVAAWLEASLLLQCLRQGKSRKALSEPVQPSPFAMLSALPTERRYVRSISRPLQRTLTGCHYWDFALHWEKDIAQDPSA